MVETQYGYRHTMVSGKPFKIKEKYCGTEESTAARRMATLDEVISVVVEYDGEMCAHVREPHHQWRASDVIPDNCRVTDAFIHRDGNAHIYFEIDE